MKGFTATILACLLAGFGAYHFGLFDSTPDPYNQGGKSYQTRKSSPEDETAFMVQLGGSLYAVREAPPKVDELKADRRKDPITMMGRVEPFRLQEVSSSLPGNLLFIGEEIPLGAIHVAGGAPFISEPCDLIKVKVVESNRVPGLEKGSFLVNFIDGFQTKVYRRLMKGQTVRAEQILAVLDPARAISEFSGAKAKFDSSLAKWRAAEATADEAKSNWLRARELREKKAIAEYEYSVAFLTYVRANEEATSESISVRAAQIEMEQGKLKLNLHSIDNRILADRAMIREILKNPGDYVKESEPILKLYAIDRLLAEGLLDSQKKDEIREGQLAIIEPTVESSPKRVLHYHKSDITSVAITAQEQIISASEDKTVCVWNQEAISPLRVFYHKAPIRVLAASPLGAAHNFVLAGGDDGKVYIYDLSNPKMELVGGEPIDAHHEPITAIAISPDGRFFATGGADFQIKVFGWNEKDGKKDFGRKPLYTIDRDHGAANTHTGTITSLHFTPQCTLISAARDNTFRIWKLMQGGAILSGEPIDHRTGNVNQLSVSADGQWMLFDQGKTLQILTTQDRLLVNTLQTPGGAIPFETFALFSPDTSLMLTAGAPEGRLQLWSAPTASKRGFELRQLVTDERAPMTCAAFSPNAYAGKAQGFAVSGNNLGQIYLWGIPSKEDIDTHRIKDVRVSTITSDIDANRQVRVVIEVPNQFSSKYPNGRLMVGRPVTIVIEQE